MLRAISDGLWSLPLSLGLFSLAVVIVIVFGLTMTRTAAELAERTGLGEAIMGAVFLGASTSLPEIATSVTAAAAGHADLALGNAIGSVAGQTAFLALADMNHHEASIMTDTATTIEHRQAVITSEVRQNRFWFLAMGIVMLLLGIAAIAFPFTATVAVELLLGWVLVVNGVFGLVHAFRSSRWKGFLFTMLGALLSLGVGVLLLIYPLTGILSLTLLMAVFFMAAGILRILLAFRLRPLDHWGWLLVSGALSLLLAAVILSQWPAAATWLLGLLVGIDLVFGGWTLVLLGMAAARPT